MGATPLSPNRIANNKYAMLTNIDGAITAHAGGGQANAYQLTGAMNVVSVCATGADSVKLPPIIPTPNQPGSPGFMCLVANEGAASLRVYPSDNATGTDTISEGSSVDCAAGAAILFVAGLYHDAGSDWIAAISLAGATTYDASAVAITGGTANGVVIGGSNPEAGTFDAVVGTTGTFSGAVSGSSLTGALLSVGSGGIENTITAHAGGGQGSAFALSATKSVHNITVVGSGNDSVALPAATGSGKVHWVKNSAAANSAQLYGAGTDTIDGVATGTGVAVAAGKSRICVDLAAGAWVSIYGA